MYINEFTNCFQPTILIECKKMFQSEQIIPNQFN